MRILIGNHIDDAIRVRGDMAAWTQRVLWFARNDDLVILPAAPDPRFLDYVTALTGVDPATLRIHVPPPGRFAHRLLDPRSLTDAEFVAAVADDLGEVPQVSEIFALWPSAQVARLAEALGLTDALPGSAFFAQGGGELVNNKASFRALAAGAKLAIPRGAVCRNVTEAIDAMGWLLEGTGAVMVKQVHNGAGVGNQIVLGEEMACDHVGARHMHRLTSGSDGIAAYWKDRWEWASADGRFPVVIEEFRPGAVSIYSEHLVTDADVRPTETGMLLYVGRRLSHQIVPLAHMDTVSAEARRALVEGGDRIARAHRAVGYRGYLSADAVLEPDGCVLFTEVNAQVSGSLHIYQVIAHHIVGTDRSPRRSVVEYHVPPTWTVASFNEFLDAAAELGCAWDPDERTGVIVSMPAVAIEPGRAQFVFCLAYSDEDHRQEMFRRLDERFATIPSDQIGPAPVGTGAAPSPLRCPS